MMVTSALTSMTVEATTLVHEPVPAPLLTSMGIVDAQLPTEVHVYSDVAVDVATDANTNKQGGHNSPGTDIVAVVEDIFQEEGKKSTDSHAIGDPVELELEEVLIEAMEDIDKGQPETKNIVDAHKPKVFLEQVGFMKTILKD